MSRPVHAMRAVWGAGERVLWAEPFSSFPAACVDLTQVASWEGQATPHTALVYDRTR